MDFTSDFQPRQIVCLECQTARLYAEVIQVVESRQVCWVRPLLLAELSDCNSQSLDLLVYDLRPTADLLWSLASFRPALDTEVLPLLVQLSSLEQQTDRSPTAQQRLNQFIHQVWEAGC